MTVTLAIIREWDYSQVFVGYMFHNPGGASVRGIETLFVGYMFHNPGGERLLGVLKHCL